MGFVYAGLWAVVAIYLFIIAHKVSNILYLVGGLFSFMAIWWFVNEFTAENMLEGVYGIIFRVVVGVVLLALIVIYLMSKKNKGKK